MRCVPLLLIGGLLRAMFLAACPAAPAEEPSQAPPPAAPGHLTVAVGSASHINLSWEDRTDGRAAHRLQRRDVAAGNQGDWFDLGVVPSGCTRFQSVGLAAEQTYVHRVRAESAAGASRWVESNRVKTLPMPEKLRGRVLVQSSPEFRRNGEGDLLELKSGNLIYVYGRWPSRGDHSAGAQIGMRRSTDKGKTWSEPVTLFRQDGYDLYHASLVRMNSGEIGLSYTKRKSPPVLKGEKVFRYSGDEGMSWSEEIIISDGQWKYYQTSACDRITLLADGRLVHPVSRMLDPKKPDRIVVNLVYASDDHGRTWQRKTPEYLAEPSRQVFHEASTVEYSPGKLLLLARTRTGWLWESRSEDRGETWSKPRRSNVRAPAAPPYLANVPGRDTILLVWNPTSSTGTGPRRTLASQLSDDGGQTWYGYRQIEYAQGARMSYASSLWVGRALHLTYLQFPNKACRVFQPRYLTLSKDWLLGEGTAGR